MRASEFVSQYEAALGTQTWSNVDPLISEKACVAFSNGTLHKGKAAVRAAFERNFKAIQNEDYRIENVHWLLETPLSAAYMFDFAWAGIINGARASGNGRGTALLVNENGHWRLLAEHLGPRS